MPSSYLNEGLDRRLLFEEAAFAVCCEKFMLGRAG